MDLREKKTRRSITNAFLQLRKNKPLEKITVKELAELAEISKATFYLHYRDIYDLSESLQDEVIQSILSNIEHPEYCISKPAEFTTALFRAFMSQQTLVEILFSGTQTTVLPTRIEQELRNFIHRRNPDIDAKTDMLLTYKIQGGYYVYRKFHKESSAEDVIDLVCRVAETLAGADI